MTPKPKDPAKALARAQERGLTEALAQERLALAAITKAMLLEVDDPQRVLARLDAMCRAAGGNRKVPAGTRRALLDGTRLVRRAVERERQMNQGVQTTLLDPAKPEPKPGLVDAIVEASDGPQQLGLIGHEQIGGDAEQAHEERVANLGVIHEAVVAAFREVDGPLDDAAIHTRYAAAIAWSRSTAPPQTRTAIKERRRELVAAGRLVPVGDGRFDLLERAA